MTDQLLKAAIYDYGTITAAAQTELVARAIHSGRLGAIGGTYVPELERLTARRARRTHALATSSATSGLEITLRAMSIGPGTSVIIPAVGWVSAGAAVTATGASVIVAPVDSSLTSRWEHIQPLLTADTAAVIVAHLRGMMAPDIARTAAELYARGLPLIEDCAQAWGATDPLGRPAGSYGTTAVFSVQTYKLIAAGEGGVIVTNDALLASRMRVLAGDTRQRSPGRAWRGNARMSDVTAALAIPQLQGLDDLTERLHGLQGEVVRFVSDESAAVGISPVVGNLQTSNGSTVGTWWETSDQANDTWTSLNTRQFRTWHPRPGDLHCSGSWPDGPPTHTTDPSRYLDIQIPFLASKDHGAFINLLRAAFAEAGALRC